MVDFGKMARDKRQAMTPEERAAQDSLMASEALPALRAVPLPSERTVIDRSGTERPASDPPQVRLEIERGKGASEGQGRDVAHFRGGVTGYESFRMEDMASALAEKRSGQFPLCGGTPGSWDRLTVDHGDVAKAIALHEAQERRERDASVTIACTVESKMPDGWYGGQVRATVLSGYRDMAIDDGKELDVIALSLHGLDGRRLQVQPRPIVLSGEASAALAGGTGHLTLAAFADGAKTGYVAHVAVSDVQRIAAEATRVPVSPGRVEPGPRGLRLEADAPGARPPAPGAPDVGNLVASGTNRDGLFGLWVDRNELEGRGRSPQARLVAALSGAVAQPEWGKDGKRLAGISHAGETGIAFLKAGFGPRQDMRKLFFDAKALAEGVDAMPAAARSEAMEALRANGAREAIKAQERARHRKSQPAEKAGNGR